MKAPRVLVAGLFHESHSFVPGLTRREHGATLQGGEMWRACGDESPLGAALQTARELGWEVIPALDWRAMPGPIVADEVIEWWWKNLESVLEPNLDGAFLVLHGAMVSQSFCDVEGEVLGRLREKIGPRVPIGGATDLHANFSGAMAQLTQGLVTYRENPHTDGAQTGRRAARLLHGLMTTGQNARTLWRAAGVVLPPTATGTADEPMRELEALARDLEAKAPQVLAVNVHAGYAFADTPHTGVSFSIVTTGETSHAQAALQILARCAWESRESALAREPDLHAITPRLRTALKSGSGPVLLVEPADNIGGGAPGDATHILRFLLCNQWGAAGVILNDPDAVQILAGWEIGQRGSIEVGGKSGSLSGGPVKLEVELLSRSDGVFDLEDPHSHLASMGGARVEMGPCAVVKTARDITLLLTTHKMPPFDLAQWRSQGVMPENLKIIGVKAAVAHRRAYDPIARASFRVSTPGPCASDLKLLPYRNLSRPIFPLDAETNHEINSD